MKIAIMQPYFFPYIGYFQLMNAVDEFVIYDNIKFTKKGWINRNRILVNGKSSYISIPVKKDSDYLNVKERYIAESWSNERRKLLNRISDSYRRAPYFDLIFTTIEKSVLFEENNLFIFLLHSIETVKEYLEIPSFLVISSTISINHELKAENKVIEICKARKAKMYLNPIGGIQLYDKHFFLDKGITLHFLKANEIIYKQFKNEFVPSLSILDVMMFNSKDKIKELLKLYELG
jgi:hypothetical protein